MDRNNASGPMLENAQALVISHSLDESGAIIARRIKDGEATGYDWRARQQCRCI